MKMSMFQFFIVPAGRKITLVFLNMGIVYSFFKKK